MNAKLRCPDCHCSIDSSSESKHVCVGCNRSFDITNGIINCLPTSVYSQEIKENEKSGWQAVYPDELEEVRANFLEFPYIQEQNGAEFYNHAAEQFDICLKLISSIEGKRGLDLGGCFGWGAYRFTERGAIMSLADYNDSTPSGLGGSQVFIDHGFSFDRVRSDAEALPFADEQFDFVFSCSFLHHLTRPQTAIEHISRVLKPGGQYFAIMEAFCPFWSSRNKALKNAHNIDEFLDNGINEQVFYQREYENWFRRAGLNIQTVNPRWDIIEDNGAINWNERLRSHDYTPECLNNRQHVTGAAGKLSRFMLSTHAWRYAANPKVFPLIRNTILSSSQKLRLLVGTKCFR